MREYVPSLVCALLFWVLPALLWRRVVRACLYDEGESVTECNRPEP